MTPEKLQHILTLLHARELQRLLHAVRLDLVSGQLAVGIQVTAAHEQDIAKLDLRALFFGDLAQRRRGNGLCGERVVLLAMSQTIGVVIQEHAAAHDPALLRPGADAEDVGLGHAVRPVDLVERHAVVELRFGLVPEMPQAVPLAAGLRVEGPDVVVDDPRGFLVHVLGEGLAAEEREVGLCVQRPVEVDTGAGLDLAGGGGADDVVGQSVEGAKLVVFAVSLQEERFMGK